MSNRYTVESLSNGLILLSDRSCQWDVCFNSDGTFDPDSISEDVIYLESITYSEVLDALACSPVDPEGLRVLSEIKASLRSLMLVKAAGVK